MAVTADFEKGTNGSNIAVADPGSLTPWDAVQGSTLPTYDNTHVAHGTLACKCPNNGRPTWGAAISGLGLSAHFVRVYAYYTAFPSSGVWFCRDVNGAGGVAEWGFKFGSGGVLQAWSGASGTATFATPIPLNQWFRLEYHAVYSTAGSGSIEAKLFTSADSSTAAETISQAAVTTGVATVQGWEPLMTATAPAWYDQAVAAATAYPGPFPVNSVAPTVSGSAPVGSTLTCDGGTWNATFTISYQWTSDGANIGGATSSTYVTQAGDAGHAIGCTVTATGQQATNESATQASSNAVTPTSAASTRRSTTPSIAPSIAPSISGR